MIITYVISKGTFLYRSYSKARFSQKYAEFAYVKHISQNGFIMFPPFSIGKHCFFPFPVSCKWRIHESLVIGIPKPKKVTIPTQNTSQNGGLTTFEPLESGHIFKWWLYRVSNHLLSKIFRFLMILRRWARIPSKESIKAPKPTICVKEVMTFLTKICIPKGCSLSRPGPGNKSLNGLLSLLN